MGEVNKKEVGQRIRGIRASLGETAEKFGERFDPVANRGLVSAWENGRYLPNNERLVTIADIADISVDELLYGSIDGRMNKNIRISNDVLASLVEREDNLLFTIVVQDGYRETRSINLIDEEITKLRDFLNEEVEVYSIRGVGVIK